MLTQSNKKYLGIVRQIAITDFKLKYEGSVLGYLWSLVKPILLFSILYYVFTQFFKIGNLVPFYPAYLLLGIVMWTFFVETTAMCLGAIVAKGDLIRKIYFPRIILVLSNSATALLTFSLNLLVVLGFMLSLGVIPSLKGVVLFVFILIEFLFLVLGLALILSSLYVKFRDLTHIWEVVLQFMFYATPLVYPVSMVPIKTAKILMLSPVAQIVQDARFVLITNKAQTAWQILGPKYFLIPYILPFILFAIGLLLFQSAADKFAEEV